MSKVSNYPSYNGSNVSIGGSTASADLVNGVLDAKYGMSDDEATIYNYALSTIASILPQLNTFDSDTKSSIQSQVDAYKTAGMQDINEIYNPLITNLQNDIASRFGNLDNSIFSDNLSKIESERADAISSFAQNVLSKQSTLESDELTKRYALVQFLNGLADSTYDKALQTISLALNGGTSANNYSADMYEALSSLSNTNSANTSDSLTSALSSLIGNQNYSSLFSSFL